MAYHTNSLLGIPLNITELGNQFKTRIEHNRKCGMYQVNQIPGVLFTKQLIFLLCLSMGLTG